MEWNEHIQQFRPSKFHYIANIELNGTLLEFTKWQRQIWELIAVENSKNVPFRQCHEGKNFMTKDTSLSDSKGMERADICKGNIELEFDLTKSIGFSASDEDWCTV